MQGTDFRYTVTEHIATLSEKGDTSKELNLVAYGDLPPKYDLRSWKRDEQGEKLLKGLTLTREEASLLKDALNSREDL